MISFSAMSSLDVNRTTYLLLSVPTRWAMRPSHPLRMTTSWPRATSWAVLTLSPRLKVIGEEYVRCPLNASVRLHIRVRKANDRWPRMLLIRRFELDCIGATCPVGMRVHDRAVSTPLYEPVLSALD